MNRFEVEFVYAKGKMVFARALDRGTFAVTPTTTLAGCKIKSWGMPRALNPDGTPRLDLFAFEISGPASELDLFPVGAVVVLQ